MNRAQFVEIAKAKAREAYPESVWPGMTDEGRMVKYLSEHPDGQRIAGRVDDLEYGGVEPVSKAAEGPPRPREEQAAKLDAMADSIARQMGISKAEAYGVIAESLPGQQEIAKYAGL